ncbi:uncharacterized protein [Rutidosis leptorrhynchoides]|uniref:uncharacterized protein n=1 Tax=Rutidosis leptorrhynchoides TaxID=125765 RepID=UPI003A9A4740
MEGTNGNNGSMVNGIEKLVGNNYKYWKMCMEAFLQGHDLWELVAGGDAIIPVETLENIKSRRKWKVGCGKTLFALRTSISKEFIEHVRDITSPKEVWDTLEKLFSKKNTARLQFLENEFAILRREGMIVSEYFLRVKNLCSEISEIDVSEKISEARLRRYLIRDLKKEYVRFITSIQGWTTQPSVEELENLLSNQEALAKQMAKGFENDAIEQIGIAEEIRRGEYHQRTLDHQSSSSSSICLSCSLTKNLVSVPQITESEKHVLFGPTDVKVLENVKEIVGDVLFTGENKGSLFVLSAGEAYVKKTSQTDNGAIWHARLGHVGYQMLKKIFSHKLVDGIPQLKNVREEVICQGCQYGKSHRLPYKKSTNRKQGLLDLIHTDLMGPTRTTSYSGHCYVMVLIDDYSRFTWVKFLKEKSEALSKFIEFKEAVESEFGRKVKALRSDNGGEFMSNDLFAYCKTNGISHQMTCPDTPQQNGVSERKIAYLV